MVMKTKEKVVAFTLFGGDQDCMYPSREKTPGVCPVCFNRLEDVVDMSYHVRKRKGDLFCTYDFFRIVTEKFKRFCEENKYPGLIFTPITASPGYYYFRPTGIYKLDYVRCKTKFITKRECCGSYDEVIGGFAPGYKDSGFLMQSDDFILASEYWFGSFERKAPLIIVGTRTKSKMKEYGLSNCFFFPIYE